MSVVMYGTDGKQSLLSLNPSEGSSTDGVGPSTLFTSALTVGDVDGDGWPDKVIGNGASSSTAPYIACVIWGTPNALPLPPNMQVAMATGKGICMPGTLSGTVSIAVGPFRGGPYDDIAIGSAGDGAVYLVYGSPARRNTTIDLSNLNNTTGFKIKGPASSWLGWSVSMGTFSRPGFADLAIGLPNTDGQRGAAVVLYGTATPPSGIFNIPGDLNPQNGVYFSNSLSSNPDTVGSSIAIIPNLLGLGKNAVALGAPTANPDGRTQAGQVLVIHYPVGGFSNTSFPVSAINGTNGVTVNGVYSGDQLGGPPPQALAASKKGEFAIGAPLSGSFSGSAFYFSPRLNGTWPAPVLELSAFDSLGLGYRVSGLADSQLLGNTVALLSNFNNPNNTGSSQLIVASPGTNTVDIYFGPGIKGLSLTGKGTTSNLGSSITGVQDPNGGLTTLLVGATQTNAYTGTLYEVRGDFMNCITPAFTLKAGGNASLALSLQCSAVENTPEFAISGINTSNGWLAYANAATQPLSSFLYSSIRNGNGNGNGNVLLMHDGSELATTVSFLATHMLNGYPKLASQRVTLNVTFVNQAQRLVVNSGNVTQGGQFSLNTVSTNGNSVTIIFTNPDDPSLDGGILLSFVVQRLQCSGTAVLLENAPSFFCVLDGSSYPPTMQVYATRGGLTVGPYSTTLNFKATTILSINRVPVCQGETIVPTNQMLQGSNPLESAAQIQYSTDQIFGVTVFNTADPFKTPLSTFTQAQIDSTTLSLAHNGLPYPPSWLIRLDGGASQAVNFVYTGAPVVTVGSIPLNEGGATLIAPYIQATSFAGNPLTYSLSGTNMIFTCNGQPVSSGISQNGLSCVQVKSTGAGIPSGVLSASDGCSTVSAPFTPALNNKGLLLNAQASVTNGAITTLSTTNLLARVGGSSGDAVFNFQAVAGQPAIFAKDWGFRHALNPKIFSSSFIQSAIPASYISVVVPSGLKSGTLLANVSVTDTLGLSSNWQMFSVSLIDTTIQAAGIAAGAAGLAEDPTYNFRTFGIPALLTLGSAFLYGARRYFTQKVDSKVARIAEKMLMQTPMHDKATAEWFRTILIPCAQRIFSKFNTKNVIGLRSELETEEYLVAIKTILEALKKSEANPAGLALTNMNPLGLSTVFDFIADAIKEDFPPKNCGEWFCSCCVRDFDSNALSKNVSPIVERVLQNYNAIYGGSANRDHYNDARWFEDFCANVSERFFSEINVKVFCFLWEKVKTDFTTVLVDILGTGKAAWRLQQNYSATAIDRISIIIIEEIKKLAPPTGWRPWLISCGTRQDIDVETLKEKKIDILKSVKARLKSEEGWNLKALDPTIRSSQAEENMDDNSNDIEMRVLSKQIESAHEKEIPSPLSEELQNFVEEKIREILQARITEIRGGLKKLENTPASTSDTFQNPVTFLHSPLMSPIVDLAIPRTISAASSLDSESSQRPLIASPSPANASNFLASAGRKPAPLGQPPLMSASPQPALPARPSRVSTGGGT